MLPATVYNVEKVHIDMRDNVIANAISPCVTNWMH